ncbi:hypothetical protein [Pedobacter namyangjuensis]|uniref:hypothetical protein n=1 Tax=Pedobacter namyangjuensis TaxID=600626 RepID=UPI000DE297FD|nr:hypothetical protein [Pedobacter namyangjuensis]
MKQAVEFRKLREFGDIIGDTFLFIKQNFKPLFKCIIYLCGIFILAGLASTLVQQLQMSKDMSDPMSITKVYGNSPFSMFYRYGLQYLFILLFFILIYTSLYTTVLSYISLYIRKGNIPPSVAEVWAYYKYYFLRMMGSGFVMTIFFVLGFILCLIPGFYILPAFTLFFPIMIMENGSFGYSFTRSFKLTKDNWWITFATIIVILIITSFASFVINIPAYVIAMISAFTHLEQPITKTYAIVVSLGQYLALFVMTIPIISGALLYYNLAERAESGGLLSRINNLGRQDNTVPTENIPEEY